MAGNFAEINEIIKEMGKVIAVNQNIDDPLAIENKIVSYLFDQSDPMKWIGFVCENPMRFKYSASSFSESFNHSILISNRVELIEAIDNIVLKESDKIQERKRRINDSLNSGTSLRLKMEKEIDEMRLDCESMEQMCSVRVGCEETIKENVKSFEMQINGSLTTVIIDLSRDYIVSHCSCGIPQNCGYPCKHVIYLAKHNKITALTGSLNDKINHLTHPSISKDNYLKLYSSLRLQLPNPNYIKETEDEVILLNELKEKRKRTKSDKEMKELSLDYDEIPDEYIQKSQSYDCVTLQKNLNAIREKRAERNLTNHKHIEIIQPPSSSVSMEKKDKELLEALNQKMEGVKRPNPSPVNEMKRKYTLEEELFVLFEQCMKKAYTQCDINIQKNYRSEYRLTVDSFADAYTFNLARTALTMLLKRKRWSSIDVYPIIDTGNETDVSWNFASSLKYVLIPQYMHGKFGVGHYILNVVNLKEKKVIVMNTLQWWPPFFINECLGKSFSVEIDESVVPQKGSLECGFRTIYHMFKIIQRYYCSKRETISFELDDEEFHRFKTIIVECHNKSILISKEKFPFKRDHK